MARRSSNYNPFDPGHRREKKAFRQMGKAIDGIAKIGALAYHEHQKNKRNAKSDYVYNTNSSVNVDDNTSWVGCGVLAIGIITGIVVLFVCDDFGDGLSWFIVIGLVSFVLASLITMFTSSTPSEGRKQSSYVETKSEPIVEKTECSLDKVDEIYEMMLRMAPQKDIMDTIITLSTIKEKRTTLKQAILRYLENVSRYPDISIEKEKYIDNLIEVFSLSEIQNSNEYVDFVKTLVVQDMVNGITPARATFNAPINLQKGEVFIWGFDNTVYYEEVTERTNVGASDGLSIRIAKGVYYRVGAFKGQTLVKSSLKAKYGGALILTNKNIIFYSKEKSMRFPYSKIISYVPFDDSIGIQLDKANAKTFYIGYIDGRHAYNIVSNIPNIS